MSPEMIKTPMRQPKHIIGDPMYNTEQQSIYTGYLISLSTPK